MVEAINPALNEIAVEVELVLTPKFVSGVNGKEKPGEHEPPVPETVPSAPICAHCVEPLPRPEMMSAVVEAVPLIASLVAVAVSPIPTLPELLTMKLVAVEDPITNDGPVMPLGLIESRPYGVDVPMPTFPEEPITVNAGRVVVANVLGLAVAM